MARREEFERYGERGVGGEKKNGGAPARLVSSGFRRAGTRRVEARVVVPVRERESVLVLKAVNCVLSLALRQSTGSNAVTWMQCV